MEFERKHSSGVAKAGLTTGIIGDVLGATALLGGGASLLGGWGNRNNAAHGAVDAAVIASLMNGGCGCNTNCGCNENQLVTRYDAQKDAEIASLKSDKALLEANTYQDQKSLEMYKYVDGRMREIEAQLAKQAVINQATSDGIQRVQDNLDCCCDKMDLKLAQEAERRCCGDNSIVNYVNATFYPQQVANVTTGTTTTQEPRYNPLPKCCGCENVI